ncbi:copper amine oxidase N-terminal domain-containing protein [Paenibacillus sp. HJL G12]|uniref:Copper amine oxidase N-terminal domain-containing protein n=2 Tax=Paenibacillus dendrobii TaxID=2691084 RepID=A0A7X3IL69_9BACL|nr:copper amine oxidase N-terminal domain-containing protein [Paenibacillus dendrobii]MWV45959.1 copper amine oxidase N-terminal domain-containing protein [Paenibacillus dendrobii]
MLVAVLMVVSFSLQPVEGAAAAKKISVYVDGVKLNPLQAPTMVKGRTMLPMRAIFEAFDAEVLWNQKTSTVTAIRDDITIVLKIGAQTATVNNQKVALDVPAQNLYGTTMVPVRFVSETLGAEVLWNQSTQTVSILTSNPNTNVNAVSYVSARLVGKNGDGRDLEVSFPKVQRESEVSEYRVLVVKSSNAYGFTLSQALSTGNYTTVRPSGDDQVITLSTQSKDVNGDILKANQSYSAYVLTVGKKGSNALSGVSPSVTLSTASPVSSVSSVKASDVNDYGDGRDISVSFNQPQNTSNIQNYRVMVVKTKDAGNFNLNTANALASSNYSTVSKTNSTTVTTTLSSAARDTSGEYIKNGVSYTVFVLSVASGSNATNQLSAASSSFTLTASAIGAPVITKVEDVSNYGDGRDLMVRFNKSSDESRVGSYRIFVVKDSKAGSFNLSTANGVSSAYYSVVSKTGYNINQTLSSGARDVDGSLISPGVVYRVFVMAVGTGSYSGSYALSSSSSSIVLYGNTDVNAATNVSVSDVSDYGDGRDLRVSFTRAADESSLYNYRIMVVKASDANYFSLSSANAVSSSNYTNVSKTGYNITQTLSSGARDVDGQSIRNGVSYRVFVLSVGAYNTTALSSYSPAITLSANSKVYPATNVAAADVADYGDGRDLRVTFTRANEEYNISEYRIMVVRDSDAYYFDLSAANAVSSSYYTRVSKTGNNTLTQTLSATSRDVDGRLIQSGTKYRVFVLSVGAGGYYTSNALSSYSSAITLSESYAVGAAKNVSAKDVGDSNNGSDLQVTFTRADNDTDISQYRVMVVKASKAGNFNDAAAINLNSYYYTAVRNNGNGSYNVILNTDARDTDGEFIVNGVSYKVFVLSVGNHGTNALSGASGAITLDTVVSTQPVGDLRASDDGDQHNGRDLKVSFIKASDEKNILEYRIFVVNANRNFNIQDALASGRYTPTSVGSNFNQVMTQSTTDTDNKPLVENVPYNVYVLSYAKTGSALAGPASVTLTDTTPQNPVTAPSDVAAAWSNGAIDVTFSKLADESQVQDYFVVISQVDLTSEEVMSKKNTGKNIKKGAPPTSKVSFNTNEIDANGNPIDNKKAYLIYVLTVGSKNNALSKPIPVAPVQPDAGAAAGADPANGGSQ